MLEKKQIAGMLKEKGFTVDETALKIVAEKDGYRITLNYNRGNILAAVIVEVADTSTSVSFIRNDERGVLLEAEVTSGGDIRFTRKDGISIGELTV